MVDLALISSPRIQHRLHAGLEDAGRARQEILRQSRDQEVALGQTRAALLAAEAELRQLQEDRQRLADLTQGGGSGGGGVGRSFATMSGGMFGGTATAGSGAAASSVQLERAAAAASEEAAVAKTRAAAAETERVRERVSQSVEMDFACGVV